jgi:hypothetical protein
MFRTVMLRSGVLAVVLGGAIVAAAEAQTPPAGYERTGYCTGGLSTLTGSFARFHLALDDDGTEPGMFVVMRFIDQAGNVVKSRTATIGPNASASLEYRGTASLLRVQAEIYEPSYLVNRSGRRTVLPSEEREAALVAGPADVGFRLIGPGPMKIACSIAGVQ